MQVRAEIKRVHGSFRGNAEEAELCKNRLFTETSSLGSVQRKSQHCESRGTNQDWPEDRLALPPVHSTEKDEKRELTFGGAWWKSQPWREVKVEDHELPWKPSR